MCNVTVIACVSTHHVAPPPATRLAPTAFQSTSEAITWRGGRLALSLMSGAEQFQCEMEAAWDYVDANYQADEVWGDTGSQAILRLATRASHHDMPYAMSVLAGLVGCTNGASVCVFPGADPSPVSIAFLNVNMPQTRKSQITSAVAKLGAAVDKHTFNRVKDALRAAGVDAQGSQGFGEGNTQHARVRSSTLTSFTEAAFFQRCAGDWDQVQHPEPTGELRGRFHYSTLLTVDEAYKFLKMLGLVSQSSNDKKVDASAVPDAASEFNKLMQTGHSALATKTAGTFGEAGAPRVNVAGVGNVHPSVWIPIERGEVGTNHVAVKERLLVGTGRPVDPHHAVPVHLQTDAGFKRWIWSPLLRVMVEPLGLPPGADDPARAAELLERVLAPAADASDDEGEVDSDFVPDAKGYRVTLVDGYVTRLRFRVLQQDFGPARSVPEFRVANRDIDTLPGMDLTSIADRVLAYFGASHMDIPWTTSAKQLFRGFCAAFDANTAVARGEGDVAKAARLGAAPWHLSNLSTALLIFEIGMGEHTNTEQFRNKFLPVNEPLVTRAYKLLSFLHGIPQCWAASASRPRGRTQLRSQDLAAASHRLYVPDAVGQLPKSQFGDFAMTQAPPATLIGAGDGLPAASPAVAGDGLLAASPAGAGDGLALEEGSSAQHAADTGARVGERPSGNAVASPPSSAQAPPHAPLLQPGDRRLPPMTEGYGEDGSSVQDPIHGAAVFSDREIMHKTLLRGEAVIFGRKVIDSLAVKRRRVEGGGYSKESVKLAHWKAVMLAGLAKHRVGAYDSGATCITHPNQPRVRLDLPPDDQAALQQEFHNRLMMLCQLQYVKLTEAILKRHQKGTAPRVAQQEGAVQAAPAAAPRRRGPRQQLGIAAAPAVAQAPPAARLGADA